MFKKIISVSKRSYVCEKIKKNDHFLQRSPKLVYNKIFLSHLLIEEDSHWKLKGSGDSRFIAQHPSLKYVVSILNETNLSVKRDVYAIALMPLKEWLVKDKNRVVMFKDSYIASSMVKIIDDETESILDLYLSANFLSDILSKVRPTGYIVNSVNLSTPPILIGELQTQKDESFFIPMHKGFPNISILPENMTNFTKSNSFNNDVFCEMIGWEYNSFATGRLLSSCPLNFNQHAFLNSPTKQLKSKLSLDESIHNLLDSFNLKDKPFSKLIMNSMSAELKDLQISAKEINKRESFTGKCVISIDPIDAKDLDDALHIELLADGNCEVGVHIADVSHFVKPQTPLDKEASSRTTSTYLVHKVIPMLPEILSENLCSLNPDVEKLTFSVVFIVDNQGNVVSERFVKSVIKPTMRLNYEEASAIIEGRVEGLPMESHSEFDRVKNSVLKLDQIAKVLRRRRIDNGALVLDKVELKFSLEDADSGSDSEKSAAALPSSFHVKTRGSSHFLIEEWMLMANQAAARLVYNHALAKPGSRLKIGALLRKHPHPDSKQHYEMIKASKAAGISLDPKSSDSIQQRILDLKSVDPQKSLNLSYICYFNMQLAVYCCAEKGLEITAVDGKAVVSPFHHYGLNVPLYTHFTSPIRRYADILVHRQIDAIVKGRSSCGTPLLAREEAALACNSMRPANRRVQERLHALYMAAYLNREGWRLVKAVVLKENKSKLSILLPSSGIALWADLMELAPWANDVKRSQPSVGTPMSLQLRYSPDCLNYKVDTTKGYTQYVHQWHEGPPCSGEEPAARHSFDDHLDRVQQRVTTEVATDFATFSVNIFEPIDCILCCSSSKLELSIEMPFPAMLPQLRDDMERHM